MSSQLKKIKIPSYHQMMIIEQQQGQTGQQQGQMMSLQTPPTPTLLMNSQNPPTPPPPTFPKKLGQMKTTPYTLYKPPFSMRIHIPPQQIKKKQMMSFPTTPTTPTTPPTPFYPFGRSQMSSQEVKKTTPFYPFYPFGRSQMSSQEVKKTPPNPKEKKISFDASLPQETKKTNTRLKRHGMSADDKSNFYSKSNIKKMRGQSRTAVPTMKQFFKSHLATRYKKSVVREIMSVLNAKVEQKVKTKRDEVANLNLQQARKYFLEEIIMEEMQNMALGKPLTLLPKVSQIYPNHVTIKNPRNENTFIPIEEGVTNGMIRLIYASLIGVDDPSKIIFLKDGNLIQDADYTESCIINAIVTL